MKFLIYDKETGVVAKILSVPNPSFLHLNHTDQDAFVEVVNDFESFDDTVKVIEANGQIYVEQAGARLDIVVEGGYSGHSTDEGIST